MGLLYKKGEPGKNCRKEIVSMSDERYIVSFKAATGFHVVLEYPGLEEL